MNEPIFGEWTPVAEQTPPLFEPVIVTRIDKWGKAVTDSALYMDDGEWRLRECGQKDRVHRIIGWMPYPRPMEYERKDRP